MSSVHYKFKSNNEFKTLTFDGVNISVADLRKEIVQKSKMGKLMDDFHLQITNPQTGEEYKDEDLIPKNTSVIVARIPIKRPNKGRLREMNRAQEPSIMAYKTASNSAFSADSIGKKPLDLVTMNASEDDKIKAMMDQSTSGFDQSNYVKPRHPVGPPPRSYVCYRCNQPGHYIHSCPHIVKPEADFLRPLKRSSGIPNSFMRPVVDLNQPGVMLTSSGHLAVPTIDANAFKQGKKEKPPFVKSESPERVTEDDDKKIPGELLCVICNSLLTDAVVIPCCGNSYCDDCIRTALMESDEHKCPYCETPGQSPDILIPNKFLRAMVTSFINETSYVSTKKPPASAASSSSSAVVPASGARTVVVKSEPMATDSRHQPTELPTHLGMPPQLARVTEVKTEPMSTVLSSSRLPLSQLKPVFVPGSQQSAVRTTNYGYQPPRHGAAAAHQASSSHIPSHHVPSYSQPAALAVSGSSVGQSQSAPSLLSHKQPENRTETPPSSVAVHRVVYVDQHGKVLAQHTTTAHPTTLMAPRSFPEQHGHGMSAASMSSHPALLAGHVQPLDVTRPAVEPRYMASAPPGIDASVLYTAAQSVPPAVALSSLIVPPPSFHLPPPGIPLGPPLLPRPQVQLPPAQGPPVLPPGVAHPASGRAAIVTGAPPPAYQLPDAARLPLPVDMILRPPPPVAGGFPPTGPPVMSLPPTRPPSGLLSEEEFYREKQRLLSQERKLWQPVQPDSRPKSSGSQVVMKMSDGHRDVIRNVVDPLDEFAKQLMDRNKKCPPKLRSPSHSKSRSRSRSRPKSPSPPPKRSASPPRRRSRSVSASRGAASPASYKHHSVSPYPPSVQRRSLSPRSPHSPAVRRRSFSRSPLPAKGRSGSRSPGPVRRQSPSRSPLPPKGRLGSRSPGPVRRQSPSRSPLPPKGRSGSHSPGPVRRQSPSRSHLPPKGRSGSRSPGPVRSSLPKSRARTSSHSPSPLGRRRSPLPPAPTQSYAKSYTDSSRSPARMRKSITPLRSMSPRRSYTPHRTSSKAPRSPSADRLGIARRSVSKGRSRSPQKSPPPPAKHYSRSRSRSWSAKRRRSRSRSVTPRQRFGSPREPRSRSPQIPQEYKKRPASRSRSRSRSPYHRQRFSPSRDVHLTRSPPRLPPHPSAKYDGKESPRLHRPKEWSPGVGGAYGRHLPSHPYPSGPTGLNPYMPDKLRPTFGPVPGFNEMDPRWNEYMRSVTEWYERMGYPGFNPFLPQPRSRSPQLLMKRSRSRSAGSSHKRKRLMSPEHDRRSRSRDVRGRAVSHRSRSRDSGSRYGFTDKETRSVKQNSKNYSTKQHSKLDSRPSKSNRVEKLKSRASKSTEVSTKEQAPMKHLHTNLGDVAPKIPKSEDRALKQMEHGNAAVQQSLQKASIAEKTGMEATKLRELPVVQQKKKVVSLLDLKIQPIPGALRGKKVVPEPVYQIETIKMDQRHVTANSEQRSNLKVETDKAVVTSKKADEITPQTLPVLIPVQPEKELVETAPAVLPASPVPECVVEEPSTAEAEPVTNEKPVSLPATSDERHETSPKPESAPLEQTAQPLVTAEKTEVSIKNIAQVKPLLVASIPEKSKWERDTDVSDSRESPVYASRNRDRPTTARTSLPRSVLESADQALRLKSRQPSVVSSIVRSPPPRSSVQKIASESNQSLATEKHSAEDVRTVVHTKSRDLSSREKRRHHSSSREKHSSSSHQRSVTDRNPARSSEQLLITVTEDDRNAMADSDKQTQYRAAFDERKVSIVDEDQFEPDYDESEMAVDVEHKLHKESTGADGMHSRRRHSRHASNQSDSATKSKKHKKHKKSRKHKSKSKKSEK